MQQHFSKCLVMLSICWGWMYGKWSQKYYIFPNKLAKTAYGPHWTHIFKSWSPSDETPY